MKTGYLTAFGMASALTLTACGSPTHFRAQSFTDAEMQRLLSEAAEPTELEGKYHIIAENDGYESGVIFVRSVTENPITDSLCAKYRTFASKKGGDRQAKESGTRSICIPKGLSPTRP